MKKPSKLKKIAVVVALLLVAGCVFGGGGSKEGKSEAEEGVEVTTNEIATSDAQEEAANPDESIAPDDEASKPEDDGDSSIDETGIRPEFKEAMDSYEAFYDEYIEFMKLYQDDPTNAELLAESADMIRREAEMAETFEAWEEEDLTTAETAYYLEVQARVLDKLAEIM